VYSGLYSTAGTCTTAANFQWAQVTEVTPLEASCYNGQPSFCYGTSSVAGLTNEGIVTYSGTDTTCSNVDGLASISFFPDNTCANWNAGSSAIFACAQNSTTGAATATYNTYSGNVCGGASTTSTSWTPSTTAASTPASATNLGSFCHAKTGGGYVAYTCNFWSAAPSVSVSVVALLAAALLSLLATKNL